MWHGAVIYQAAQPGHQGTPTAHGPAPPRAGLAARCPQELRSGVGPGHIPRACQEMPLVGVDPGFTTRVGFRICFRGSMTAPIDAPVNASDDTSRCQPHDSGALWVATPSTCSSSICSIRPVHPGARVSLSSLVLVITYYLLSERTPVHYVTIRRESTVRRYQSFQAETNADP